MLVIRYKKPVLALIVVFVAASVMINTPPVFSQQGTLFSDQFYMGAYYWTQVAGNWEVLNGELTEINDPASYTAWATAGSVSWVDYAVEAKVRATDKDGKIYLAGRWIDENNHYALEYVSDDQGADSAKIILYKKFNGARVNLLQLARATNPDVPYIGEGAADHVTLKLSFSGATIKVFKKEKTDVDFVQLGVTADTSISYGKIALGEFNRVAFFDDIMVWDITPPVVSGFSIIDKTGTTCSISFNTNEPATARVDYGTDTNYGFYTERSTRSTVHRLDMTGLSTSTTYYYKITVTDAAGNRAEFFPNPTTFITNDTADEIPPVISDVSYNEVNATKATVGWSTNESANSLIEYGTSSGVYLWSVTHSSFTTQHAITVQGLKGNTTYYFRIKSRDVSGNTVVSEEYSFTTDKDMKPQIVRVEAGSTPSVYVSVYWDRVSTASYYNLYFSTSNDWGTPQIVNQQAGVEIYSHTWSDLVADTNYFIKIEAVDGTDIGSTTARAFPPDSNPHGYYRDNPQLCGNCHYTHRAQGPSLIAAVTANHLCITCHDGTQSKYDVVNGRYKGPDSLEPGEDEFRSSWYPSIAGPYGSIGGKDVVSGEYEPTSRHDLDIFNYSAPGSNIENIEMADAHLSCASCHDPHGSENYRILREDMGCTTSPAPPILEVEAYSVTEATSERTIYVKGSVEFCGSCHSDFNQGTGSAGRAATKTEQPGFSLSSASTHMYMHAVNVDAHYTSKAGVTMTPPEHLPYENGRIICQTCHFTHGTTNTGTHVRRDGVLSTSLKRFNETEGCEACHNKTDYPE